MICMVEEYEKDLHTKVNRFKAWTKENFPAFSEKNDNGEWCFCDEFYEMYDCSMAIIRNLAAGEATGQMIDDLLFVAARDNEGENFVDELEEHSEWFALLCRRCLQTGYVAAKWQFAKHLPNCKDHDGFNDFKEIIYDFFKTDDEYTDRMALQALAEIYPEQAERYAVDFWERKKYEYDEYQKIMVLHVLFQIHSPKLPHYLALAEKSEYRYLRENAEDLYDRLSREPHNG